jgi:chemotaxis protein MotB
VAAKDNELAESQARLSVLQADIKGLRSDLAAEKASARQLDNRLKAVVAERDALIAETTTLKTRLQDMITRVPALRSRLEKSLDSYQAAREDLTEAKARETTLAARQKAMKETYDALVSGLKQQLDSQEASIQEYRQKLKISFVDRILFGFSQVRISPKGKAALDQLAGALSNVPKGRISIIGHADNVPVASKFRFRFPSNWELSSARAGAVARYLLHQTDLDPARVEVIGLSRYHPVAGNDTQAGRAKNRRVEIIITPGWQEIQYSGSRSGW